MVVIAVAGGTGKAGGAVVAEALARGYDVRSVSRNVPIVGSPHWIEGANYLQADFRTGVGVAAALEGVDALIETLDARTGSSLKALPTTSMSVLAAASQACVKRCVLLSIVNAAQCAMGYYQVQASRARSYEAASMSTSVVYATQFHNLVAGLFSTGSKIGLIPAFVGVSFQPIAPADVAKVLVDEAVAQLLPDAGALLSDAGTHRSVLAGGPSVWTMKELAEQWKHVTGRHGLVTSMPIPTSFGTFLRAGKNLIPEAVVGTVEFRDWLVSRS